MKLEDVKSMQVRPVLAALEDEFSELRDASSVLESYAQLCARVEEQTTSLHQVSNFLMMVFQTQTKLLDTIERKLETVRKQPNGH